MDQRQQRMAFTTTGFLVASLAALLLGGCGGPPSQPPAAQSPAAPTAQQPTPVASQPAAVAPVVAPAPATAVAPAAGPSWQAVGWGGGGHFVSCAFHPTKPDVIYLGGDVNGCFVSEDAGKHWSIRNNGISNYAGFAIAVDPRQPDSLYLGTSGGICRSDDRGLHWTFLPETAPGRLGLVFRERGRHPLLVDPADGALYVGSPAGAILRSADRGATWTVVRAAPAAADKAAEKANGIHALAIPAAGGRLLVVTVGGVLLDSADRGATWKTLAPPQGTLHVIAAGDGTLYAACAAQGVGVSTDGGATWILHREGMGSKDAPIELVVDPGQPRNVCAIAREGYGGAVLRSTDGGATWTRTGSMRRDLHANPTLPDEPSAGSKELASFSRPTAIAIAPWNPQTVFVAADWRAALSTDGGSTWDEREGGADMTCVHDIRFLDGTAYVTAMDEGLLSSPDQGATWTQLAPRRWNKEMSGHQWRVLPQKLPDGRVRTVSLCSPWDAPGNRVLVSEDGGKTFLNTIAGLPERRPSANTMWGQGYARALAADPRDPAVLYLGIDGDPEPATGFAGGGLFKSSDGGHSWAQLPAQPGSRRMFYGLAVDPTDSKRLYWGGCNDNGGLYRSEDGGASWQLVFKEETWVFNVLVTADGTLYCPGKNLWRSTDHGATWTRLTSFTGLSIVGLEQHPTDPRTLWLSRVGWGDSTNGEIHRTSDGGATWQDITGDIPHRNALVLRYDPVSAHLWAGSVGLYRLKQ